MEKAVFKGMFLAQIDALQDIFPAGETSGLWHAWEVPEGCFMVRAVSSAGEPLGEPCLLQHNEFVRYFRAVSDIGSAKRRPLHADAPDLLSFWEKASRREMEEVSALDLPGNDGKTAGVAADSAGNGDFLELFAQTPEGDGGHDPERAEQRAEVMEAALRGEFALLLQHLQQGNLAAGTAGMERLLASPGPFFEKQRYMFIQFGLALRHAQQYMLALQSFQRALEFEPADTQVLMYAARCAWAQGAHEQARQYTLQVLQLTPGFPPALDLLDKIREQQPAVVPEETPVQ